MSATSPPNREREVANSGRSLGSRAQRLILGATALLLVVVLVSAGVRVQQDLPHVAAGTATDDAFAARYVAHPLQAYLHIVPGAIYLMGALAQLSARVRTQHYTLHRRLGRALLACALLSGVMAMVFGARHAWGGTPESLAAVIFGGWFLVCLIVALWAIRVSNWRRHRRWMVRAFAVGLGVATIRLWVGLFTGVQVLLHDGDDLTLPVRSTFGLAFWLGLGIHVAVGEWWLRRVSEPVG